MEGSKAITYRWILIVGGLILLNLLSFRFYSRIDLTEEGRYTISNPVKKLLRETRQPVQFFVFLHGEMPSGFKMLSQSAAEMLHEFKGYSGGRIQYRYLSPDEVIPGTSTTWADTLQTAGILPINLKVQLKAGEQSQYIYPAAIATSEGRMYAINLYPAAQQVITPAELSQAESMFEYNFAHAIRKLTDERRPMIAYTTGNGEPTGASTYDLVENILSPDYDLFTIDLEREERIPDTFSLLLMVKPSETFSDEAKFKIDQFIMRGGTMLAFIDRLEAEMDSLQIKNQVIAFDRNLGLQDLFFRYGVRINPDLIMDLQSDFLPFDVNNDGQFEFLHWNYFPLFETRRNHPITRDVGLVAGRFVNSLDTVRAEGVRKTILLATSPNSRTIETPALISPAENRNAPVDAAFTKSGIPAAVLLEGQFTSLFKNRLSRQALDSLDKNGTPFILESVKESKMIIVGDGDIPLNSGLRGQPLPMGVNPFTVGSQYEYQFANHTFVQNCVEFLLNEGGLMQARAKDFKLRLLNKKKVEDERGFWQLINFAGPIFLIILFGIFYQILRSRRFRM